MSKKKSKARKKSPLVRKDLHKRPRQGTHPFPAAPHAHVGADPGPWQPFAYMPMVLGTHSGGESGFTTGALHAGPFAGVRPKGYARTDTRVLEDVCDLLTAHGELDVAAVDVHCRDGCIRLEGSVPDRRTRLLIAQVADGVPGVVKVENRLGVASTS